MGQTLDPPVPGTRTHLPRRLLALRGDDHLAARLQVGDEVAFEVLYDRYSRPLLSFCRHMLGRLDEAEDALQQVFASAHSDLQRNRRPIDLKPWLYAIARNRCLTMLRARREQPEPEIEPVTAGLQEQVQGRADLQELVADLGDLPDNQREALLLTELDDLSHAEVASLLGCEAPQVKGLVFRAREGLIERRDARGAPCEEIRAELSTARKGGLRRGRLRHHLAHCPGCTAYLEDVRRQRKMMALILPVIPATGLKRTILGAVGVSVGTGGAGGVTLAGGSFLTATAAKVAVVGVLVGGAGVATEAALDSRGPEPEPAADAPPARALPDTRAFPGAPVTPGAPGSGATRKPRPGSAAIPAAEARARVRAKRKARQMRARSQSRGRSRNNRGANPPGLINRPPAGQGNAPQRPATPPGNSGQSPATGGGNPARGAPAPAPRAGPKAKPDKPVKP